MSVGASFITFTSALEQETVTSEDTCRFGLIITSPPTAAVGANVRKGNKLLIRITF